MEKVMSKWMKIETAPRDGTGFLGFVNKDWIEGFYFSDGQWCWLSDGDSPTRNAYNPTHWMPLPSPPTT